MIDFFYPPQPTRIWPNSPLLQSLAATKEWDAEIKYNGWRLLLFKLSKKDLLFYNRHSTIIDIDTKRFEPFFHDLPINSVLDGELIDRRTTDLKNTIVFWDVPFYDGVDLRNKPLKERRPLLDIFTVAPAKFHNEGVQVYKIQQFYSNFLDLYNTIVKHNEPCEEGIVIKKTSSTYRSHPSRGIDVLDWLKIRKIGDHARVDR